jgi:hypothetical protein
MYSKSSRDKLSCKSLAELQIWFVSVSVAPSFESSELGVVIKAAGKQTLREENSQGWPETLVPARRIKFACRWACRALSESTSGQGL